MSLKFKQLIKPTNEIVTAFNKWNNDSKLKHLMKPHSNQVDIETQAVLTVASLKTRLENCWIYLIYFDKKLVGQMNVQVDFQYLFDDEVNAARTAWIGMGIGEIAYHNKGIGTKALAFLEKQVKQKGLKRIELGVFEFNMSAQKLYLKSGYKEIGRIKNFTFWQAKMWSSIHMEKCL